MRKNVVLIGSGNVAEAFAEWIALSGNNLLQIAARNREQGNALAQRHNVPYTNDFSKIKRADIYIISVSDSAIKEVSSMIDAGDGIVVHTSGSCGTDELAGTINNKGVLYPLQTFTKGRKLNLRGIPLFIEADGQEILGEIRIFAKELSEKVYDSNAEDRRKLHIGAVLTCNFVNHLYTLGYDFMESNGLNYEVLKPLIGETAAKMNDYSGSPADLQTGPAVREDTEVINKHLEILGNDAQLKHIYETITTSIIKKKKHG